MIFSNYSYQYFDWWHDIIPDANEFDLNGDSFEHEGLFNNNILDLGFTIGLNDYWNVTFKQSLIERCMDWEGPVDQSGNSLTVHHRTECSSSDFYDGDSPIAYGGILADANINFRYLLYNQMKGPGSRVFFGFGFDVPSKNILTESPWTKTNGQYTAHRHFYISDGAYKINLELQFFKKRILFPVFWGGTLTYNFPLSDSKYGFTPSDRLGLSLLAMSSSRLFKKIKLGKFSLSSIGPTLTVLYTGRSSWSGQGLTPNSKSILYMPGVNILISSKNGGGLGINITKGFQQYINDRPIDIDEELDIFTFSINYRTVLNKRIDWLW